MESKIFNLKSNLKGMVGGNSRLDRIVEARRGVPKINGMPRHAATGKIINRGLPS